MLSNNSGLNFDLNISNYKMEELEQILELPSNYDESIIEIKETKLRQNILPIINRNQINCLKAKKKMQ